ncbi:MAG: methylated-DNA--[protein]-cysteine S-methyltransferase, partial [Gammaproteobacteria bacterium]|nr:methylated-DNA--[protein]-cysteine S-methyltransferase [Gammaproteobacteria bacterium]
YIIPCHRVIRRSGGLGGYRWGLSRKKVMQAWESAQIIDARLQRN